MPHGRRRRNDGGVNRLAVWCKELLALGLAPACQDGRVLPHEERVGSGPVMAGVEVADDGRAFERAAADVEGETRHGVELVLRHRHRHGLGDRRLDGGEVGGEQRVAFRFGDRHAGVRHGRQTRRGMADTDRPDAAAVPVGGQAPAFAPLDGGASCC